MQRRTLQKEVAKMPPLPKSEPPLNDPPYEVIEFPSQQYSNTCLLFGNKAAQNKKEEVNRKCDLCGSSNAQYHCEMCVQQAFCVSCDQMYHRHPKRQNHIRKRLPSAAVKSKGAWQPPVPPKGESLMAPIPPPRRNKRAPKNVVGSQPQESLKKNGSIMGSLKRFVGGIQPVSSPFQPKTMRNDSRPPKFAHSLHSAEFDRQSLRRDGGYLGWELQDRHRSGSVAALNGPGFSPMIQAQSMAQLNCPSCHHHGGAGGIGGIGGVSGWDWNRSQMNLNAPFQQAWPGMQTGTWHGSIMFPPAAYRMPGENFSDHSSSRRGSIRHQRYDRRRANKFDNEDDSESDVSLSDDRKSRREASPALSRRSRRTVASDSEDETLSRKNDRRFKRRVPMSRDPSPAMFRPPKAAGYRSKKFDDDDDDDAISVKSSRSRKSRRSPISLKSASQTAYLKKNAVRCSSSDSDDELTSERDGLRDGRNVTPSDSADDDDDHVPPPARVQSPKRVPKMSHITKTASTLKTKVAERVKNYEKMQIKGNVSKGSGKEATTSPDVNDEEDDDWECEHCTYLNPASARVCDVCCKSKKKPATAAEPNSPTEQIVESMKALDVSSADTASATSPAIVGHKKKGDESNNNKETVSTSKTSTGTSPPPQSAATQTYEVPSVVNKRNRSLSFDDYSDWNPNKKSSGAASFTSDTNQSISLQSKQEMSPQPSQSPVLMDAVLQKQMKDSLEIVKLLKDAEKHQFTPDDLTVALIHCGENNPVKWLLENWTQMIDTVVTLATNFGHEQPENTIGTISCHEARSALHLHNGDLWAAATECIRQRQRKYAKLMAQGNFSREDVVTVLTANHGDIEAAYMELRKSQLKPFLMKIWGPPQGLDNESGNTVRLCDEEKYHTHESKRYSSLPKNIPNSAQNNFNFVHSWLQSIHTANPEDTDSAYFVKLKDNLRRHASAFYLNTDLGVGNSFASEEYSDSNDELYSMALPYETYLRYRSCENLNIKRPTSVMGKRFHKSSESLFYNRTKSEPRGEFFLPHSAHCASKMSHVDLINKLYENCNDEETHESDRFSDSENFEDVEASAHSSKDYYNLKIESPLELNPDLGLAENQNLPAQKTNSVSSQEEHVVETDSLEGSVRESASSDNLAEEFAKNPVNINATDVTTRKTVVPLSMPLDATPSASALESVILQTPPEPAISNRHEENSTNKLEESKKSPLFDELKALYELAKLNLEFLIISNNDASVEVENSALSTHQRSNNVIDTVTEPEPQPEPVPDVAKIGPEIPTNYLSKAYIEIGPSSSSFRDNQIDKNDRVIEPSISDDLHLSNENYQSDSDDNFVDVDVDTKESTESNFISENSSDDDQSFIEEKEEQENEHMDKLFHEVLAENIKEYIEQEAALIKNKKDTVADQLELVSPVVLNPTIKPVHIIRINVPDNLINTPKFIDPDIKSQIPISSLDKNDLHGTENSFEPREDPTVDDKSLSISLNTRINLVENETNEKEAKINEAPNEVAAENPPLTEVVKNDNFSEYIREIVITQPNDYVDKKIVEENQRQMQSSPIPNGYETDTSDHSSIVKQFHNIAQETDSNIGEITKEEQRQKERTQDGYLSDASDSSFKIEVENCLTQGLSNYDQAVLAAQLIKLKFDRSQSIDAASECSTIQAAITYLQQDCQLCAEKVSIKQMISMLECEHRCCQSCAQQFFSLQILEKSIVDCVCPFCKKPKISDLDSDEMSLYFSNLDILLKTILQPNVHELFQQKLRDRTLMQDPNFKWCIKCSSGFIADPDQRRVFCPDCNSVSCAQCGKLWDKEHDGKTCEQYNSWLSKNNVGSQLSRYLEDFGVTCPKCDTKFILVKGGCMHLTCSNCKYEFCSDCMKPFAMGTDCKVSEYCIKLGLHAHHPRNCLFYLRDKEPQELKQLLKDNNVPLELTPKENPRCDVPLQKETEEGLIDTRCGARVEEAGLCRTHFIEYLTALIKKHKIDPIVISDLAEILQEFRRRGKSLPIRAAKMLEYEYRRSCIKVILEEIPLE